MKTELIREVEARYLDEWIAIEVTETNAKGDPVRGVLIAHSKDRDEVEDAIMRSNARDIMTFYNGEVPIGADGVILYGDFPL
ncbi:MAG: hypothetical protein FJ272_01550 [Planctomycetes bacterium]|nr:hypothetical protein [Planctomycetota bacterium]